MACSNNVVRCALTPKFRDVDLLVDMLTYNMAAPAVLRPHIVDENRKRFTPPVDVFEIELINVRNLKQHARSGVVRPGLLNKTQISNRSWCLLTR